ncbi:YIPF5 [Anopheles darlingi]|uniref:YIPF5 n=1 Tax=Anopheles darlingi TaxID=43151 RepID=W5JHQ8_ANODA|nr:protein YIPF5 [Anopheles darlingi]ETN63646.1 YIPF5 [Anopheles darlingi]
MESTPKSSRKESDNSFQNYDGFSDIPPALDFQTFQNGSYGYTTDGYPQGQYMPANPYGGNPGTPIIFTPSSYDQPFSATSTHDGDSEFDEPPLLDELEIYPRRILEKSLAVLKLFHTNGINETSDYWFKETDLAGPIFFCLILAACLSISASKAQFGYIYGLSAISVMVMYCLIYLMGHKPESFVSLAGVASVLGYSMLPIVGLSIVAVIFSMNNLYGMVVAGLVILVASMSASRFFCMMTGNPHQRYLLAYPCALLYAMFTLLVLF